jgi:endonuclease/exonuclease/phosphatase family metal-dependent hydrolase
MKNILLCSTAIVLAMIAISCSSTQQTVEDNAAVGTGPKALTNQFKMLTINTQHNLKDKTDVKKFAEWVRSTGAELVAVQQITRSTDSKPEFDSYTELLKRLDMRGTFAKARYFQGWDSGNALFCMYPLLQSNAYTLPTGKGKTRRSLAFGVFELGLKSMAFASTDLDEEDLSERVKQVYEILSIQKSLEESPIVVAGNFGESPKGKGPAKMLEKYLCANTAAEQTSGMEQHVYLPVNGKMKVISSEKKFNKNLNTNGLLVTVEVTQ